MLNGIGIEAMKLVIDLLRIFNITIDLSDDLTEHKSIALLRVSVVLCWEHEVLNFCGVVPLKFDVCYFSS
jgi:hypothetical protein